MSVPKYFSDGDYSIPQQQGQLEVSFPFNEKNDPDSFEVVITYRVQKGGVPRPRMMHKLRTVYGDCYLVAQSTASSVGNGILEYTRTYASVPRPRTEYITYVHSRQEIINGFLVETQEEVPAAVVYEYSLRPLPVKVAPKVIVADGVYLVRGGFGTFVPGKNYLAETTEIGYYKARIWYRKSIFIRWQAFTLRS
jgi:hypothetical protein